MKITHIRLSPISLKLLRSGLIFLLTFFLGGILLYQLAFFNKIYPGVRVANMDLSGKTLKQAEEILQKNSIENSEIQLIFQDKKFRLHPEEFSLNYDFEKTADKAFSVGRSGSFFYKQKEKLSAAVGNVNIPLTYKINSGGLGAKISLIAQDIFIAGVEPSITLSKKGEIFVSAGKDGLEVEEEELAKLILSTVANPNSLTISIPTKQLLFKLTPEQENKLKKRARALVGKKIQVEFEDTKFTFGDKDLLDILVHNGLKKDGLSKFVDSIALKTEREPQNARFVFKKGKVEEFAPAKDGVVVKKEAFLGNFQDKTEELISQETNLFILSDFEKGETKELSISLPVIITKPEVATEEVNNLGIKELIGKGSSKFRGSAKERVHNILLASKRLSGLLIKPGEVFSFNQALGEVESYTGYQQAYIIKDGKTILGDGGGVCQVSTTLFRAALASGLPIIKRSQHSYRVAYYEQDSKPGIDATIYSPSVDLVIKNDTGSHVLVSTSVDTKTSSLTFELYGTKDGRRSEISTPRVYDVTAAPPPLYQDDPTLAQGMQKQIDFAAQGAKVSFNYKVVRADEVLQNRNFYSDYRPWQAVYLRGTAAQ